MASIDSVGADAALRLGYMRNLSVHFGVRSRKETTKATTPRGRRTRFGMTRYRRGVIACDMLKLLVLSAEGSIVDAEAEGVLGPFPHLGCVPLTP